MQLVYKDERYLRTKRTPRFVGVFCQVYLFLIWEGRGRDTEQQFLGSARTHRCTPMPSRRVRTSRPTEMLYFLCCPHLSCKVTILPLHRGTRKLNFLCKALTCNNMTYKSTVMIPIRSDSKSMPINCRTLNWRYKTPVTTVFIFAFLVKTKSKLKTDMIKKNFEKIWPQIHIFELFNLHHVLPARKGQNKTVSETTTSAKSRQLFRPPGLSQAHLGLHISGSFFSTTGFF